jgi:hypothetical protein
MMGEDEMGKSLIRGLVAVVVLVLVGAVALVRGQTPAPAMGKDLTVAQSVSPELVGSLSKELNVTPFQAQGGAGALLGLAKTRLKPEEFAKVSSAIPGTDGLLKAAPAVAGGGMMGGMGGAMGLASLGNSFKQLGLSPDMAMKMAPALVTFLDGKGAADAARLLGGVLK